MSHAVVGSNSRVFSYRKVCITDEDTNAEEAFEFISTCSRVRRDDGRNVVGPWSSMRQYVHSRCKQFYTTRRGHYKSWSRHMASMERKGSVVLEVRESRQVLGKRGERQRERERERARHYKEIPPFCLARVLYARGSHLALVHVERSSPSLVPRAINAFFSACFPLTLSPGVRGNEL